MKREDFDFDCECGYRVCCGCGTPWYPMEAIPSDDERDYYDCPECGRELSPLFHGKITADSFSDHNEFGAAIVIHNSPNGMGRNVAQYYLGDTWVMNAYERFGSIWSGLSVSYMFGYTLPDGRNLIPEMVEGVEYDETCVFGQIAESDIPEKCHPFDCGYGGTWCLSTNDEDAAMKAAFEMWKRDMTAKAKRMEFA